MHADVRDRGRREVLLQRLPPRAVVEREEHAELGAGVEQARTLRILANHSRRMIHRDAVVPARQLRPGRTVIVGPIDVGLQVVFAQIPVDGDVRRALPQMRRVDVLDAAAGREIGRRDVLPGLAVVARHVDRPIVGADPDHAPLERRFVHRVDARIDLLAGDVTGNRAARHHLIRLLVRGQVRADHLPRHPVVDRAVQDVRRLVDRLDVVRRHHHDRLTRKPEADVVRVMTVAVLRIDPPALGLPGHDVEALDFSLARAPDHAPVRCRPDSAGLAPRRLRPRLRRMIEPKPRGRHAGDDHRRVVLLWSV